MDPELTQNRSFCHGSSTCTGGETCLAEGSILSHVINWSSFQLPATFLTFLLVLNLKESKECEVLTFITETKQKNKQKERKKRKRLKRKINSTKPVPYQLNPGELWPFDVWWHTNAHMEFCNLTTLVTLLPQVEAWRARPGGPGGFYSSTWLLKASSLLFHRRELSKARKPW